MCCASMWIIEVVQVRCIIVRGMSLQVAATGTLDLRGRVWGVDNVKQKITQCREQGVDLCVVPRGSLEVSLTSSEV